VEYSGGFDNLDFVLQVPEPGVTGFLLTMSVLGLSADKDGPSGRANDALERFDVGNDANTLREGGQ
jgi:hypothetical protein